MTVKTIPLTAISVVQAKPNTRFGQPSILPVSTVNQICARASLLGIPTGATVQSAVLTLRSRNNPTWAGTRTVKARMALGAFSTSTTWNTKPTTTATNEATTTQTSAPFGVHWDLAVTAIVQAWVSGTATNYGFEIFTTDTNVGQMQGATAPWGAPYLTVTYVTTAVAPTALHPSSGAVSLAKPTLSFQTPSDIISLQVQVDPAANGTTPGFDSGEVAATAGLLDLTTTAYAGLTDGSSTQWRARVKNGLGWSAWSSWVSFSRTAFKTLTITSPTSTSEDPSPVVTATYGGTVTAWRVITKNALGAVVQDSGWTPGTTVAYGTTKSVGTAGSAVVQVRDNVLRDNTPGDPDYAQAVQAFIVTPSGTPTAVAGVVAAQNGISPVVTVSATRASGVPDEVAIYRNGVLVGRAPGADVFTGTTMTFRDITAPMNTPAVYAVYAIVNGSWSNVATAATITPTCIGRWILDTYGTAVALILGNDDDEQAQPEIAIVHRPVSGPDGQAQVVRRRLSRYPREGSVNGELADAMGVTAAASEAALRGWTDNDAGHIYRYVRGNQNDPVILGDIDLDEMPENTTGQRVLDVALNWWYQEP